MRGITLEEIHNITKIDLWFLYKLKNLAQMETSLRTRSSGRGHFIGEAKRLGFPDKRIEKPQRPEDSPIPLLAVFQDGGYLRG